METSSERLLQEFPPSSYEDWRQAAVEALDGAPFEKKLLTPTYEGLTLQPVYVQSAERERNPGRDRISGDWSIAQDGPADCAGLDPLGVLATDGTLPCSLEQAYAVMHRLTVWAQQHAPQIKTILVDVTPYHNSGAHAVQELAFAIATGAGYLRALLTRGLTIEEIAPRMQFIFALGTQYFIEIAKLRAARIVWAKVVQAFGGRGDAQQMAIHAQTGRWNTTMYEPYVNLLRTTVETFAGVAGGSDSVEVSRATHSTGSGLAHEIHARIARNTQLILKEEAHLDKVADPAGGSWYVETLTDEVARAAWILFQEIERMGGMFKALEAGFPQEQVAQTAAQRLANLATRKDVLVGTNMYPNLQEEGNHEIHSTSSGPARETHEIPEEWHTDDTDDADNHGSEKLQQDIRDNPRHPCHPRSIFLALFREFRGEHLPPAVQEAINTIIADQASEQTLPLHITPLQPHHAAEQFEALRLASDAYKATTGRRPKVFMANMGPAAQHKARADFSIGFFEVGGFEMIPTPGFASVADAAAAAIASDAPMVVICSTDDTYPAIVPPLTQAIKTARPQTLVILAGYPKDHVAAFKAAGVDEFIHLRANVYEILSKLQALLLNKT